MLKILFLLIFAFSTVHATEIHYWNIEIPIFPDSKNVSSEKDPRSYTILTSYDLEIDNTQDIYHFYDKFFESIGWENPFKNHTRPENNFSGKWSASRTWFNLKDQPEAIFSSSWKSKSMPTLGQVKLTLTDLNDNKFTAHIEVVLSPEIDTSAFSEVFSWTNNPANLFLLHDATGGNPFDFDSIRKTPSEKYKDIDVVKKYYQLVGEIYKQYQTFGEEYVTK